jgi:hypothetical protein
LGFHGAATALASKGRPIRCAIERDAKKVGSYIGTIQKASVHKKDVIMPARLARP